MDWKSTFTELSCPSNCSGHGDCDNGTCLCKIEFKGGNCTDLNLGYFVSFGLLYYALAAISLIQLSMCIYAEYIKHDKKSFWRSCRITTQKMLYLLMIVAASVRSVYFTTKEHIPIHWSSNLLSAFYPILLSGFSLIICFWAEAFHLDNVPRNKPRFLSKSCIAFIVFNLFIYALLAAEIVSTQVYNDEMETYNHVLSLFNGCFAAFMIIIFIFFLVYGVEVFFKVRGAFSLSVSPSTVNSAQLHMSRTGLVIQAGLQLITALFILSDVCGNSWKTKIPITSQNMYDIMFRIVELAIALWFPCVLWNWKRPDELWVLNPAKLLTESASDAPQTADVSRVTERSALLSGAAARREYGATHREADRQCWICYDSVRSDAGQWISPCRCSGDVGEVHHDCLKRWLLERENSPYGQTSGSSARCAVCGHHYRVTARGQCEWSGAAQRWWWGVRCTVIVLTLSALPAALWWCAATSTLGGHLKAALLTAVLLAQYAVLRVLGVSVVHTYQEARVRAFKIFNVYDDIPDECTSLLPPVKT